jgi:hypothetical protein
MRLSTYSTDQENPWSRTLPSAGSARHLQYMNGRHTRNKRVMKRVSNAVMTRECHADVVRIKCSYDARMSRRCCANNVVRIRCRCHAMHPTWEARFIAWVTFGQNCNEISILSQNIYYVLGSQDSESWVLTVTPWDHWSFVCLSSAFLPVKRRNVVILANATCNCEN